jgi:dipeptidyl aminopeptidase/acylaminoacyl peptidase
MSRTITVVLFSLSIAACAVQPTHESLKGSTLPPLLPVRDFVANTDYNGHYRISPDGKKLAWKAVAGTREEIFVRTIGRDDARSLGFGAQGYSFVWAQDSRRLLFIKDAGGNENFHLFRVAIDKPDERPVDITPLANTRVAIQQIIENDPAHILVIHNGRDKAVFDLYRLNLDSGEMELLYENTEQVIRVVTDRQGRLRARVRQDDDYRYLELPVPEGTTTRWSILSRWRRDDDVQVLKFNRDGDAVYMLSNRDRDKVALVRLDVITGNEAVVYAHPGVDVSAVQFDRRTLEPALAYTQPDYPQVEALDPRLHDALQAFRKDGPAGIYVSSVDDAQHLLTVDVNDDREVDFYLLDRRSGRTTLLGRGPTHAFADKLASMRPIRFQARDGLTLRGYLTLPATADRPLPTVLLVHGGPFHRDIWQYNREAQFLANRGYAVLQVNYRGSRGYGRAFMQAAIGEFAGKMQDDLIDAVNWAVEQGIADPAHIAIMGRSFGGYATLVGLSMTPETFACGIDIVGPADLATLDENFPAYWKPFMHRWRKYAGDPDNAEDRARMRAQSPLYHAGQVVRPVLIIQGANDVRVKQDQSDRMVAALRAADKDVDYLVIEGEGHRIRHWKNRLKEYRAIEDFLAPCLGGRSSGFDYYQLGSWLF